MKDAGVSKAAFRELYGKTDTFNKNATIINTSSRDLSATGGVLEKGKALHEGQQ